MRYWPATRSFLIALVLAVGLIDGCPLPSVKRAPGPLKATVKTLRNWRQDAMRPTRQLRDGFRLHQTWKLFPTASIKQQRMWIEGRRAPGDWEVLYRPTDDEHAFRADAIEYRRVRGAWNPGRSPRRGYTPFTRWISREAFAARPDIDEVRVRVEDIRVKPKEGQWESSGRFQFERTALREKPRERPAAAEQPTSPDEETEP